MDTTTPTNDLERYLLLARRALSCSNYTEAKQYFELAKTVDPNNWEANFYSVYCAVANCRIFEIQSCAIMVNAIIPTTMNLIRTTLPKEQQREAALGVATKCTSLVNMFRNGAINHYNGIDIQIRNNYSAELNGRVKAADLILFTLGDSMAKNFKDDYSIHSSIADLYDTGIDLYTKDTSVNQDLNDWSFIDDYLLKILKFNPRKGKEKIESRLSVYNNNLGFYEKTTESHTLFGVICIFIGIIVWLIKNIGNNMDADLSSICNPVSTLAFIISIFGFLPLPVTGSVKQQRDALAAATRDEINRLQDALRDMG